MESSPKIGIIGGTGFSGPSEKRLVKTDYGNVPVTDLEMGGKWVVAASRHGEKVVPHLVNYRGIIQALIQEGVQTVLAVSACGRLAADVLPGHLVIPSDFDYEGNLTGQTTHAEPGLIIHPDPNDNCSPKLRQIMADAWKETVGREVEDLYRGAADVGVNAGFHEGGTYYNINGPGFATAATEDRLRREVKDPKVIGMTLGREAKMAKEMALAYGPVAMCTDHSQFPQAPSVKHDDVMRVAAVAAQAAKLLIQETVKRIPDGFHEPAAHDALRHSLHPGQVDLARLIRRGRPRLAHALAQKLGVELPFAPLGRLTGVILSGMRSAKESL